jgi:hypothetical protein
MKCFAKHNIPIKELEYKHLFGEPEFLKSPVRTAKELYIYYWRWRKLKSTPSSSLKLPYPLVYAYSDIVIVSANYIRRFCHFCGILAAQGLFVEIALPTALLLSAEKIITHADLPFKGVTMWTPEEVQLMGDHHGYNLSKFVEAYPEDVLYFHPIKLSKWDL